MLESCKKRFYSFKYFFFGFILVFLDLVFKYLFRDISLFENNFFFIKSSINYGSTFGMFSNVIYYNYFVIILSFIIIFLIYYYRSEFNFKYSNVILILFLSGLIGNLFDRIFYGYVRDFIGFKNLFIFNLADLYLFLSVLIYFYFDYFKKK